MSIVVKGCREESCRGPTGCQCGDTKSALEAGDLSRAGILILHPNFIKRTGGELRGWRYIVALPIPGGGVLYG